MVASAACTLPQCLCGRPERPRMKTSQSGIGVSAMRVASLLSLRRRGALLRVSQGRLAHPGAVGVRLAARLQALPIARAVAGDDALEFAPVDLAAAPVSALGVEAQLRIGEAEAQIVPLRHSGVDELLPQVIVGETLDL